jgi:hypothetical protein
MEYPRGIFASAVLLDNKIVLWTVRDHAWESPYHVSWKSTHPKLNLRENIDRMVVVSKKFIANDDFENNLIFDYESTKFFAQWEIHEYHCGAAPYRIK